jgi:hypothetical protein
MFKFLFVYMVAFVLAAQPTWNGLRFGMGIDDAKRQMTAQGLDLQPVEADEKRQTATPDYELKPPDLVFSIPFKAELYFDSTGLSGVNLALDEPKFSADVKTDIVVAVPLAVNYIYDTLVTKYGAPVSVDGPCSNLTFETLLKSRTTVRCEAKWRGDSQIITVTWWYGRNPEHFAYLIQYKRLATEL